MNYTGWLLDNASTALFVNTRIISRRYSGVSAEVVSGLAVRAASSPMGSAVTSFRLPLRMESTPLTSRGAGLTAGVSLGIAFPGAVGLFLAGAPPSRRESTQPPTRRVPFVARESAGAA